MSFPRITIDKYERNTVITIRKAERSDMGQYRLVLTNSAGSCEMSADGIVLGRPTPPQGPLVISDVRAKRAKLEWKCPEDDGGCPLTGYRVERQDQGTGRWIPCGDVGPDETSYTVDGLTEGKK